MEQIKTPSQQYRDEEAFSEAIDHMDWHLLAQLRELEREYIRKIEEEDGEEQ